MKIKENKKINILDAFPQANLQMLDAERGVCNPYGINLYQIQTVGHESTDL